MYKYHLTNQKGWCNDPNGTIIINGEYHVFYQYYPDDVVWGPMHWGHAISRDLIHWDHKEIALFPDENGYCFSGSCVYVNDFEGRPALLAFYTSHNPDTGEQQQCLAYSYDLIHFEKYASNPIIKNKKSNNASDYFVDFRDPKVFENKVLGGYSMVLAAGNILRFYHSINYADWQYTGEFKPADYGYDGVCECPDCFACGEDYVLSLSVIIGDNRPMPYFVGDFDGYTFNCYKSKEYTDNSISSGQESVRQESVGQENVRQESVGQENDRRADYSPLLLDYGPDNYAMISFARADTDAAVCQGQPILIGWGENWEYINNTPLINEISRGKMTLPRKAYIADIDGEKRLVHEVLGDIPHDDFELIDGQSITLYGKNNMPLVISVLEDWIEVAREASAVTKKQNTFMAKRCFDKSCDFKVYQDENYFEIIAEKGLIVFSIMVYA